jgi:hypothetical protein
MRIEGMFPLEEFEEKKKNSFFKENYLGDLKFLLSGRCAIYYCLLDISPIKNKTAYLPAYNCETVVESYLKAGWDCLFYDVDKENLQPMYKDEDLEHIGLVNICGYYGVHHRNQEFLKKCKDRGIIILQDSTFTPYSINPYADYVAGSFRKWMGIASGGIALKRNGNFKKNLKSIDQNHLDGRLKAMEYRKKAILEGAEEYNEIALKTFWDTELSFRKTFGEFISDQLSINILYHFDFKNMKNKRVENYNTITSSLNDSSYFKPVFNFDLEENDCPSHFSIYVENREKLKSYLLNNGINSTTYWPLPPILKNSINKFPNAKYIYEHILSIQLDQRYSKDDMSFLVKVLNKYCKNDLITRGNIKNT